MSLSLINYSNQSYGCSLRTVDDIIKQAKEMGIQSVGLTDIHSLSNAPEFLYKCQEANMKGVVGVTFNVVEEDGFCGNLILLAKNDEGYLELKRLIERYGHIAQSEGYDPSIGIPRNDIFAGELRGALQNCVLLDGYRNSFGNMLIHTEAKANAQNIQNAWKEKKTYWHQYREMLGGVDVWVVEPPNTKPTIMQQLNQSEKQFAVVDSAIGYASSVEQLSATMAAFKRYSEPYFLYKKIDGKQVDDAIKRKFHGFWVNSEHKGTKVPEEKLLSYLNPLNVYATQQKSERLKTSIINETFDEIIQKKWSDFSENLKSDQVALYESRLNREIDVIKKCNFENYFVNIAIISKLSKQTGNEQMLRGSAVGSLVLRVMGLTPIDPVKNGLLFERFMNEHRIEEPDVDIDMMSPKQMIHEMSRKIGNDQIAFLSNDTSVSKPLELLKIAHDTIVNFYGIKEQSIIDDVNSAFNWLSKELDENKKQKFAKNFGDFMEYVEQMPIEQRTPSVNSLVDLMGEINKVNIKSDVSINSLVFVPDGVKNKFVEIDSFKKGNKVLREGAVGDVKRITQNKYNLPYTGAIKYDLLPNRNFTRLVKGFKNSKIPFNYPILPNNSAVKDVFNNHAFLGVNQVSGYVGATLAELFKPQNFNELIAINALIRDGDSKDSNATIDEYIRNKKSGAYQSDETNPLPPPLKPILTETYGCLLYEEQLLQLLNKVGGFSWENSDKVRSSIKKKKWDVIDEIRKEFVDNVMATYQISKQEALEWFKPIASKKGKFLFNKAHASSYAHLALQQCWLKMNSPAHYYAELYLDKNVTFRGSEITLGDIMLDWQKTYTLMREKSYNQQNLWDFALASLAVVEREMGEPYSTYKKELSIVANDFAKLADTPQYKGFLPQGETPDIFKEKLRREIELATQRIHARLQEQSATVKIPSDRTNHKVEKSQPMQTKYSPDMTKEHINTPIQGDVMEPVALSNNSNKKKPYVDWDKSVTIGESLLWLNKTGVINNLDIDTSKSATLDHFRFSVTKADGGIIDYHIAAPSVYPDRFAKRNKAHDIVSGLHQGGTRNRQRVTTLDLLQEINCHKQFIPTIGQEKYRQRKKDGVFFLPTNLKKPFKYELTKILHNSGFTLGQRVGEELSQVNMEEPVPPLMGELTEDQYKRGYEHAMGLLSQRYIDATTLNEQLQTGDFSIVEDYRIKAFNGVRYDSLDIVANYREVQPNVPLYEPLLTHALRGHVNGGHQRFFFDKKKNKVGKIDHGTTTKGLKAIVSGKLTKGSELVWLTEASIDSLSFNELQRINKSLGVLHVEPNSLSVKNAGGASLLLQYALGVEFDKRTSGDFKMVSRTQSISPLNDKEKASIKSWFMEHKIHTLQWSPNDKTIDQIEHIMRSMGMTDDEIKEQMVIHPYDQNKNYNQNVKGIYQDLNKRKVSDKEYYIDQGNMKTWLRASSLGFTKAGDTILFGKKSEVSKPVTDLFSQLPNDKKATVAKVIKERFVRVFGAKGVGFALDNDHAGIEDIKQAIAFCQSVGIPSGTLLPRIAKDLSYTINGEKCKFDLKDHNDYLKVFKVLSQNNMNEEAMKLMNIYAGAIVEPHIALTTMPSLDDVISPKTPAQQASVKNNQPSFRS
jgi:hypothetical protein